MNWILKTLMFLGDKQCSTDCLETILNAKKGTRALIPKDCFNCMG